MCHADPSFTSPCNLGVCISHCLNTPVSLPDTFLTKHKASIERETDDDIEVFIEQVLQELEAQLKETEIAAVGTMQDRQQTPCVHLRAKVDDPNVGQASGNQQA